MKCKIYLCVIALVWTMTGISLGAGSSDMAMQNTMLKQRLDQLDKEIQDLRQSTGEQGSTTGAKPHNPVWSNLDIELYGYLKLDASYDSSRIDPGDYAKWVYNQSVNENNKGNQFDMTANETRLGLNLKGPNSDGMVMSGKIEVDFYGGGAENKATFMMRYAYIEMQWPDERFSVIAGQTWDVISPLNPTTLNYSVYWWAGNIGYRRPQVRLTKEYALADNVDLKLEGAAVRTIGRTNTTLGAVSGESGQEGGFPTLEGRVSVTLPIYEQRKTTIGVSGHKGREKYDIDTESNKEFDSWSINMDLTQPICEKLLVKGEIFTGKDLDAYLGGIGQGVNTTTLTGIGTSGGWVEATYNATDDTQFNLGFTREDVHEGDVNTGDRTANQAIFGNIIYSLNSQTNIGLELSHWRTEYKGPGSADSTRVEAAVTYKF